VALPVIRSARPNRVIPGPPVRHLPALDGLRALAVIAVIGYHADIEWLPGGFLGVELFFVVSGFLITSLLLGEIETSGRLDLRDFWIRRARRLLPALALLLLAVAVAGRLLAPENVTATRSGILSALTYVTNWQLIVSDVSYFEAIGRPPLLQHLWSLAVEEQYYLLWPLAVAGLVALGGRRAVTVACAAGAVASTALMWALVDPNQPSRVYYGTDTRAAGLLVGGLLATTMVAVERPHLARRARRALDRVGLVALGLVVVFVMRTSEFDPGLYRGGFLRFTAVTAVVILATTVPGSTVGRLLSARWLRAVGVRSYGLYLWHWPVFQLTRPHLDVSLTGTPLLLLRLAVTAALAELSFRLVEQPVRTGELRRRLTEWLRFSAPRPNLAMAAGATSLAVALVVGVSLSGQAPATGHDEAWGGGPAPVAIEPSPPHTNATTTTATPTTTTTTTQSQATTTDPTTTTSTLPAPLTPPESTVTPAPPEPPRSAHAVGDSVLLAARDSMIAAFAGDIRVDAAVGRQPWDGVPLVEQWAPSHPGEHLVVVLGSNGILRPDDVDRIMAAAGSERRVVFVTVHVPRRWADASNDSIRSRAPAYPNAMVVDWAAMAGENPQFLGSDQIHPTRSGADALGAAIRHALG
jgi:peptidoglycan/LPS O-acetylase OafA/YrhL